MTAALKKWHKRVLQMKLPKTTQTPYIYIFFLFCEACKGLPHVYTYIYINISYKYKTSFIGK